MGLFLEEFQKESSHTVQIWHPGIRPPYGGRSDFILKLAGPIQLETASGWTSMIDQGGGILDSAGQYVFNKSTILGEAVIQKWAGPEMVNVIVPIGLAALTNAKTEVADIVASLMGFPTTPSLADSVLEPPVAVNGDTDRQCSIKAPFLTINGLLPVSVTPEFSPTSTKQGDRYYPISAMVTLSFVTSKAVSRDIVRGWFL